MAQAVPVEAESGARLEISPQEEKELRRVFDKLCDFNAKQKLSLEVQAKNEVLAGLQAQGFNAQQVHSGTSSVAQPMTSAAIYARSNMSPAEVIAKQADAEKLTAAVPELRTQLRALEANPFPKIKAVDVSQVMASLGKRCTKKEVVDMVWEVDENLDGCVDWDEFLLMFNRNVSDQSGLEPSKLYNMVQFLMYDVNNNGYVSVDETMNMLYARYGRARMELKLKELFGDDAGDRPTGWGDQFSAVPREC